MSSTSPQRSWSCSRAALTCLLAVAACTQLDASERAALDDGGRDHVSADEADAESARDASSDPERDGGEREAEAPDAGYADAAPDRTTQTDAASSADREGGAEGGAALDAGQARDAEAEAATDAAQISDAHAEASTPPGPDYCAPAPCVHGTCTSGATEFSCSCTGPWAGARCDKAMFQPLGMLSGMTSGEADAVNADGSVVVGNASRTTPSTLFAAIQWKATSGLTQLPSNGTALAQGVTADGLTVVGVDGSGAMRWTGGARDSNFASPLVNGMTSGAHANAISADGSVAAGTGEYTNDYPKAVRWVVSTGALERIDPSGHEESYACAVSGNGSVIVGYTYNPDTAFVWRTGNAALTALPTLDATRGSTARGVSQDGNVIVGSSGGLAVRWVNGAAPVSLGLSGVAYGANADGSVIVGRTGTAFVWRSSASPQLQLLADVLLSAGADLTGWTLDQANAISSDGRTVVGYGTHNAVHEGFIARLR